jgi:hypothetical protein
MASRVSVTVPIWLSFDQRCVGDPALDGAGDDRRVRAEVVVADKLDLPAKPCGERDPALVVVLAEPVLDQVHRELPGDGGEAVDLLAAVQQVAGDLVAAVRPRSTASRAAQSTARSDSFEPSVPTTTGFAAMVTLHAEFGLAG